MLQTVESAALSSRTACLKSERAEPSPCHSALPRPRTSCSVPGLHIDVDVISFPHLWKMLTPTRHAVFLAFLPQRGGCCFLSPQRMLLWASDAVGCSTTKPVHYTDAADDTRHPTMSVLANPACNCARKEIRFCKRRALQQLNQFS